MKEKDLMTGMGWVFFCFFYKFSTRAIPEMLVHCQKNTSRFITFVAIFKKKYFFI